MAWKLEEISEGEEEWVGGRLRIGWGGVGWGLKEVWVRMGGRVRYVRLGWQCG